MFPHTKHLGLKTVWFKKQNKKNPYTLQTRLILIYLLILFCVLYSKPASYSGQVSGQQRAEEPEAAPRGGPQTSVQPGVSGPDQHPAAGSGDAPERNNTLHSSAAWAAQKASPRTVHRGEKGQDGWVIATRLNVVTHLCLGKFKIYSESH